MASNAFARARINKTVKDRAAAVLASMGLKMSEAVRIMLTRVAHDGVFQFDFLQPNAKTTAAIDEAPDSDWKSFADGDAPMADLRADD